MVKIIYYADPTEEPVVTEHDKLIDFLMLNFNARDELLDLRFFDTDLLCHEIDQTNNDFLDINEGVVAVTHDSMIPRAVANLIYYAVVALIAAAAAILLAPSIPSPNATGRDQQSGTNALGDSTNEPRVGQRIDDIFGTVNKHVPSLWQVPYKLGVDNQEIEVLLCCVGRGKYDIDPDKWYDGDTPVKNIPNASVNIYGPGKIPNVDVPDTTIGNVIDQKIGVYRQSNDLNPSELQPGNALENSGVNWLLSGSGSNAILEIESAPDGFDLVAYYNVGDLVRMSGMNYLKRNGSIDLYAKNVTPLSQTKFAAFDPPVDLGEAQTLEYEVLNVTASALTLKIPLNASAPVVTAWSEMTSYAVVETSAHIVEPGTFLDTYVVSDVIRENSWLVYDGETYLDVSVTRFNYERLVGVYFDNIVGPVFVPENATEIILNFTSSNGFYKLVTNSEVAIFATIQVDVFELDINGEETGESTPFYQVYQSNVGLITKSVFQTMTITLPYERNKVYAQRITNRDKREEVSNVDIIEWRDMYSFEPVNVTDFGDVTLAHVLIPSNSQSRLIKQRKQNVDLTRLITQYLGNGQLGPAESYATDQFDQILIHQALDPFIGRMSLDNINADGFNDLRDEMLAYFGSDNMTKFGYNFDTTELTFQDTFITVADAVMCTPYVQSGVYDLFFEKKQIVSTMQVTCRNKIAGTENRKINLDRKNDGVELTYRDNKTGTSETVYLPADQSARNPERKEVKGCTTYEQAYKYAARMYNRQKYQIEYTTFDVDSFGRNIIPNKRLDSPDSTRFTVREGVTDGYRIYDGEVVEVNGLQVELSEPVSFVEGEDHYITFTKTNGDNSETILCTQIDEFTVSLSSLPTEPIYDGYDQDRTKYTLVSEQLQHSMALIPKTIEFSLNDDNTEIHTVNAVNYTDKYYQNDLDILE